MSIGAIVVRRPDVVKRGQASPVLGRAALLLVDDLPDDLPRQGRRTAALRSFPPFDDEALPWVHLGEPSPELSPPVPTGEDLLA
jgi:hypothetical protein